MSKIANNGKDALERAKSGEKLKRPERLAAIVTLDEGIGPYNVSMMAELFQVSERQIHKDLKELRTDYQKRALEMDLLAELYRNYRQQLAYIDRRLNAQDLEESDKLAYLKERRQLVFGFTDRITAVRLEHLLGEAEDRVNSNGHLNHTPAES